MKNSKMQLRVSYGERINNNDIKIVKQTINESPVLRLENGLTLAGMYMCFSDKETADYIVAMFPKFCKVWLSRLSGSAEFNYCASFPLGHDIKDDNVAGAFNETAIKRVNKQIEILSTIFN